MRTGKTLANVDTDVLTVVAFNWQRVFADKYVSATEVIRRLPELDVSFVAAVTVFVDDNRRVPLNASTLGLRLRQSVGLVVFGHRFAAVFDGHAKSHVWRVERADDTEEDRRQRQRELVAAELESFSRGQGLASSLSLARLRARASEK